MLNSATLFYFTLIDGDVLFEKKYIVVENEIHLSFYRWHKIYLSYLRNNEIFLYNSIMLISFWIKN